MTTTTLLSIALLTTLPMTSAFAISVLDALLAQHGLHTRQLTPQRPDFVAGLGLTHRLLNPQPEHLVVEIVRARFQIVDRQFAELVQLRDRLHMAFSSPNRPVNLVGIGSFAAAKRMAPRASCSLTPSISNRMRPGFTTATHPSGAPLPLPIPVSCGFLVIGLSGNTPTQP